MSFRARKAPGRRRFLKGLGGLSAGLCASPYAQALATTQTRHLSLEQQHTGERIEAAYMVAGRFDAQALEQLDHFFRDWRTGEVMTIDRQLYDMLYILSQQLPASQPFAVVSGYRSLKTNDMLRRHGRGAAKDSLHIQGMAIDFRLPGVKLKTVHQHAKALEAGGVGYYPKSNFIHIDTGPIRYW